MASSVGYYAASWLFSSAEGPKICRLLLCAYGLLMCTGYWDYSTNLVSMLILGFGFHQICVLEFGKQISEHSSIDLLKLSLYNEVFVYAVLPIGLLTLHIGQQTLSIYCLISGLCMIIGSVLL